MKRLIPALAALALALSVLLPALLLPALPAAAQTVVTTANASDFPLSGNVLFPARANGRLALKCYNPTTNAAVTIVYTATDSTTMTFVLQPGGSLWEIAASNLRGRLPDTAITATGTAAQRVQCFDSYLQ